MIEQLLPPDCRIEDRNGTPVLVSQRFDDIYFSADDGLAETQLVFLEGNNLKERMAGRSHFTIAETGFGTGLNFIATLELMQNLGDKAPGLHYIATEIAPLEGEMMRTALSAYPELAGLSEALLDALPPRWPGRHRRLLMGGRVTLDLLYGDSTQRLRESMFKADAWYLDGFSPARNPAMWQDDLYALMAERSSPGATLGSFTAAGNVRRGLEQAGFSITRHDGFGRKRHRITGQIGTAEPEASLAEQSGQPQDVVIIGAGIAGASIAHALKRHGVTPLILGAGEAAADGASGNLAAVQSPRLTALDTFPGRLSLTAWGYARYLAEECGAVIDHGSLILTQQDREQARQRKILGLGWPETVLTAIEADEAQRISGLETGLSGSYYPLGGTVDPRRLVAALIDGCETRFGLTIRAIERLSPDTGEGRQRWRLTHDDGVIDADNVVIANGSGLARLSQEWLPPSLFQVTAGMVSHLPEGTCSLLAGLSFGGYMARARDGRICLGASFDHHDPDQPLPEAGRQAHERNLNLLPERARAIMPDPGNLDDSRVSLRLAVPDRQPLAGLLDEGVSVLAGLGARGMVTAPLLGEHVASRILNLPSPLDQGMASVVNPKRFS